MVALSLGRPDFVPLLVIGNGRQNTTRQGEKIETVTCGCAMFRKVPMYCLEDRGSRGGQQDLLRLDSRRGHSFIVPCGARQLL
jgi:hypothetical protein